MANQDSSILHTKENGVEYFTVAATGESGLSTSGMARSLNITQQSISTLVALVRKSATGNDLPDSLKPLWGNVFHLQAKYKNAKIYNSNVWACFADYYAHDAKRKTKEALTVFRSFARIGAESFIQGKTGWLPDKYQSSQAARTRISRIMETPCPWERMYEPDLCNKIQSWYGFDSSKFWWWYCYSFFTPEEKAELEKHNPLVKVTSRNGTTRTTRKFRIHQNLSQSTRDRLSDFATHLWRLVELCDSRVEFEKKWNKKYGQPTQLEIFDLWDFAS